MRVWVAPHADVTPLDEGAVHRAASSGSIAGSLLEAIHSEDDLLIVWGPGAVEPLPEAWDRCREAASPGVALVYGDYLTTGGLAESFDPEPGAVREEFDTGPLWYAKADALRRAVLEMPTVTSLEAFRYGLRLGLFRQGAMRLPEALCAVANAPRDDLFAYVRAEERAKQAELEVVFTHHLRRVGAHLPPRTAPFVDPATYPVVASVVIPVRNRASTIADAVASALSQVTSFPFNVLVVDNHSTDGTRGRLRLHDSRLHVLVPPRSDRGIGGCWNEAARSPYAGRYLVQLDSDDVYASDRALQAMVDCIASGPWAMAVGAYRTVDLSGHEVPPGVVDHAEWTDENGHNTLLRVPGVGAPRAFATGFVRSHPFPNVSYGEDYAMALSASREYHVARTREVLYLARRWEGNTDHAPSPAVARQRERYKIRLRTLEILARIGREPG